MRRVALLCAILFVTACSTVPAPPPIAAAQAAKLPGYVRHEAGNRRVVIFIHGVIGDGRKTWTDESRRTYFPRLVDQDDTFDGADIWVYDFPSPLFGMSYDINEVAQDLRRSLADDDVIATHDEFVFVVHSMGGLVARALLIGNQDLFRDRVPMIYFYSTPTAGSEVADLATLISRNPQIANMRTMRADAPGVLDLLASLWETAPFHRSTRSFCAYEKLPTYGMYVVQKPSAMLLCTEPSEALLEDHIGIVKPAGPDDAILKALRNAWRQTFEQSRGATAAFNLKPMSLPFLQISNATVNAGCKRCWGERTVGAAGDEISVNVRVRNDSDRTVRNVRLRLEVPDQPQRFGKIQARLTGDGTEAIHGEVRFTLTGTAAVLSPESGFRYIHGGPSLPLPDDQKARQALAPGGLLLGDLEPGRLFETDVVLNFRAVAAPLLAIENILEGMVELAERMAREGDIDVDDVPSTLMPTSPGRFDRPALAAPVTWVPVVPRLETGGTFGLVVIVPNRTGETLHEVRLFAWRTREPAGIAVELRHGPTVLQTSRADLPWLDDQRGFTLGYASRLSANQEVQRLTEFREELLSGDLHSGLLVGSIPPLGETMVMIGFEVASPAEDDLPDASPPPQLPLDPPPPPQMTALNTGVPLLQVSLPHGTQGWGEAVGSLRPGDLVTFSVRCYNPSAIPIAGLRAHLNLNTTSDGFLVNGLLTARNAPAVSGSVRVGMTPGFPQVRLRYRRAWWWENNETLTIDARNLSSTGLGLGELAPYADRSFTVEYLVTDNDP